MAKFSNRAKRYSKLVAWYNPMWAQNLRFCIKKKMNVSYLINAVNLQTMNILNYWQGVTAATKYDISNSKSLTHRKGGQRGKRGRAFKVGEAQHPGWCGSLRCALSFLSYHWPSSCKKWLGNFVVTCNVEVRLSFHLIVQNNHLLWWPH